MKYLIVALSLIFIASGSAKLLGLEFEIEAFQRWGYDLWFMYFVGAAEVAGGIALHIRLLKIIAAPALTLLMLGALYTHLIFYEWAIFAVAAAITAASTFLSYKLFKQFFETKTKTAG